jgi:hypothetical protein
MRREQNCNVANSGRNALVKSDTGTDQFLCASGMPFDDFVVHTEEGIGVDPSSS